MEGENVSTASLSSAVVVLNNIGVDKYNEGSYDKAWILFKGSLEMQKLIESCSNHDDDDPDSTNGYGSGTKLLGLLNSNQYIRRAQMIASQDLNTEGMGSIGAKGNSTSRFDSSVATPNEGHMSGSADDILFVQPYIHTQPFYVPSISLSSNGCDESSLEASSLRCSTILFNLASMDYKQNGSSVRCLQLYELSLSLFSKCNVSSPPPILLALLSNIACWYHSVFQDYDTALSYMEKLQSILIMRKNIFSQNAANNGDNDDDLSLTMIMKNVCWILYPAGSASAAA